MMKSLLILAALLLPFSAQAADSRDFSLDLPADDIKRLELDANVGEVEITAADIETVEVRVRLERDDEEWFGSQEELDARLAAAELEQDTSRGVLSLRLDYDESGSGDLDLEEHWEVRLPAALALDAELNVGSMRLEGTGGGVEAEVNVGELLINVERGDIDARVNVGDLRIRSNTDSPGEFDLEANIGEARLTIDGEAAGKRDGWLGNSVSHDADGDDDVTAQVNVGEVLVDIR